MNATGAVWFVLQVSSVLRRNERTLLPTFFVFCLRALQRSSHSLVSFWPKRSQGARRIRSAAFLACAARTSNGASLCSCRNISPHPGNSCTNSLFLIWRKALAKLSNNPLFHSTPRESSQKLDICSTAWCFPYSPRHK